MKHQSIIIIIYYRFYQFLSRINSKSQSDQDSLFNINPESIEINKNSDLMNYLLRFLEYDSYLTIRKIHLLLEKDDRKLISDSLPINVYIYIYIHYYYIYSYLKHF